MNYRRALEIVVRKSTDGQRAYDRYVYPFCWNVKMNRHVGFKDVWARMCKECYVHENEAIISIGDVKAFEGRWEHEMELGDASESAIEHMRESFTSGDDTYRFCTPEREKRWGIKAPESGWKCEYDFIGRSGGWLALTNFECRPLINEEFSTLDLKNREVPALCAMLEEIKWAVDNRFDEFTYLLAFHMRYNMQGEEE